MLSVAAVYFKFFMRPPMNELMKMNKKSPSNLDFGADSFKLDRALTREDQEKGEESETETLGADEEDGGDSELDREKLQEAQDNYWSHFIEENNFIPIGAVYDRCEGPKVQLGSVVLLENKDDGGLLARTFINITLNHNVTGGTFFLKVKYNGKDLFENYWELCELEDELPVANRTFTCPIASGKWSKVKNKPIPGYLPTGRYQTKAWVEDEKKKTFVCAHSYDFFFFEKIIVVGKLTKVEYRLRHVGLIHFK
ncbi:hypothetical protein Btru_035044 [Bulinus truncatus]|nr:hypothetical protein Btru_035044 [Bulinus truncatus]